MIAYTETSKGLHDLKKQKTKQTIDLLYYVQGKLGSNKGSTSISSLQIKFPFRDKLHVFKLKTQGYKEFIIIMGKFSSNQ